MTRRALPLALWLWPALARGEPDPTGDVLLAAGAGFRHIPHVDLAAVADSDEHGSGGDQSPGSLSLELGAGMLFPARVELRGGAWLGVGGLALSRIERRYLDSDARPIGSALTVGAGASARYAPPMSAELRLFVGPAADLTRLSAASPAGSAHLDMVGLGIDAGARWRTGHVSRGIDGHLELRLGARREFPVGVWVGRGREDVLFAKRGPSSEPVYSFGASAAYVFSFTAAL